MFLTFKYLMLKNVSLGKGKGTHTCQLWRPPDVEVSGEVFCLKKEKESLSVSRPGGQRSLRRPGLLPRVTSQRRRLYLQTLQVRVTFSSAAKLRRDVTKGESGCVLPALSFGKREGAAETAGGESHTHTHACPSARLPCAPPTPRGPRGQARGVRTAGNEDAARDSEAVTTFSLKCLKGGVGRWPGSSSLAPPHGGHGDGHARPRASVPPPLTLVQTGLRNPDVLPSLRPLPGATPSPPCSRPSRDGALRERERMPSVDTRPRGHLKGSQGKPVPPDTGGSHGYTFHKVLALTPGPRE